MDDDLAVLFLDRKKFVAGALGKGLGGLITVIGCRCGCGVDLALGWKRQRSDYCNACLHS
jgi:hypothetical protein